MELKYTYILLLPDEEPKIIPEKDLEIYAPNVEAGDAMVMRILAFSEEAKRLSGKECRLQLMTAEPEEEEDDEGIEYAISWSELR